MTSPQLKLAPDLRRALDRLPKPDGIPTIQVTVEIEADARAPKSAGRVLAPTVVEFRRGVLTTAEGVVPVWVFEGPLALAVGATPEEHAPAQVAAWLREQLGPRCVAVDVGDVDEHEAMVRVAATVGPGGRPD